MHVGFLRSRPADTPREGIAWERGRPARIRSFWLPLSLSTMLEAATLSAGTASAGPKQSQGAVAGRSKWGKMAEAVPGLVRAGRPRSQEAFIP